jgi:hypothetical protein
MILRATAVSVLVLGVTPLLAHGNERGKASATVAGKSVLIDYGRPSLKGRDMLAEAAIGQPWRMGADAPTTLRTDADLSFGSASVPVGEYILRATKVREGAWMLNVNKPDPENPQRAGEKVADIPLTAASLPASVETFTIELSGSKDKGEFAMKWGTTALKASFTAK